MLVPARHPMRSRPVDQKRAVAASRASNTSPAIDLASSAFSVGGISTEEAAPMFG